MVQLAAPDEVEALVDSVRRFATDRIEPVVRDIDGSGGVPREIEDGLHRLGLSSPLPEDEGGHGLLDDHSLLLVAEELATFDAGVALDIAVGARASTLVSRLGSPGQRSEIASLCRDDPAMRGTILYYEGHGRSPLEIETSLEETSDGWQANGRKTTVVRPLSAAFSVIVGRGPAGLTALLRTSRPDADTVTRNTPAPGVLGARGARLGVVALHGHLTDVAPLAGAGDLELAREIARLRLTVAAVTVGVAARALAYATTYASEREAFGHAIAAFQGVSFPLADVSMAVDAARLGVWDVGARLDAATDATSIADDTTQAVARASRAAHQATVVAVNTLGGHGYLTDHPVEKYYRDAGTLSAIDFDVLADGWLSTSL